MMVKVWMVFVFKFNKFYFFIGLLVVGEFNFGI